MPIEILMPALSPTMEEGKLAKWLVKPGDKIASGKVIAEIETDKATMEVEAVDEGTVAEILVPAGSEKVKVNQPIAIILGEGEGREALAGRPAGATASGAGASAAGATSTAPAPKPAGASSQAPTMAQTATPAAAAPATAMAAHGGGAMGGRIAASPLAKRLAKLEGIDLSRVAGTGPHGRVVKRDIEAAKVNGGAKVGAGRPLSTAVATAGSAGAAGAAGQLAVQPMADDKILALYEPESYEVIPHDAMRRIIAERLTLSKQTIPHFYLSVDCRIDELLRARERVNAASPKDGPRAYKLSVNDFVIKALAMALQQAPAANATWTGNGMLRHRHSDIGVAVAVDGGLFTPVIHKAELKSLSEISNEMKDLAARARKRRLAPHEYQGGTTSISNLGMYGIKSFDAVINPPHATILAVGAGEKRPIVTGDRVEIATVMSLTLSCDHRVVDGALGAEVLGALKLLLEDPIRMVV